MSEPQGLIFDIQGFSVHDGPGCRTQVFLSGCPLRCPWCANPEGREPRRRLLVSRQKCRYGRDRCRLCLTACPHGAVSETGDPDAPLAFDRAVCRHCDSFACAAACPHEGVRVSGAYRSVSEVMDLLRRDRQYWGEQGGASFSGGEPLRQHAFMSALLEACKAEGMHTAVETTAHIQPDAFLALMRHVDFAFIDVKHMDPQAHRELTGVDNTLILNNIRALTQSGWPGRLILRMPVVAGFNDGPANARATAHFMESLGLWEINLLPFHRLAASKWEQLGLRYAYRDAPPTPPETLENLQSLYLDRRIACYPGDDVSY